ncbi:hypothetical protein [Bradyrhizobium cenepequi]|uniref:hypothetical protein n=1 Tax=Bradyrhizobium cenepequi TaxID=2821403 RepID=UPI001CE28B3A|nr:hypothetical protein [Bradyrhizobium cenepequi]MCA6112795.1 hypothetical protein [Bradyrhizobium cenepequi]
MTTRVTASTRPWCAGPRKFDRRKNNTLDDLEIGPVHCGPVDILRRTPVSQQAQGCPLLARRRRRIPRSRGHTILPSADGAAGQGRRSRQYGTAARRGTVTAKCGWHVRQDAAGYDGLSTAYSVKAVSAYIVDPSEPMDIPIPLNDPRVVRYKKVAEHLRINFIKGVDTRIPQDIPLNSPEADYPSLEERFANGLPSRDYFLKTLDRPHFPDGAYIDDRGRAIDDQGRPLTSPE